MPQKLLTITEAAERLSVRPGTLRRWVSLRKIEYVKAGRSVHVPAPPNRAGRRPHRRQRPAAHGPTRPPAPHVAPLWPQQGLVGGYPLVPRCSPHYVEQYWRLVDANPPLV